MGAVIGFIIFIVFVLLLFAYFCRQGKKDMRQIGETPVTTRLDQERVNMEKISLAIAEMYVASYSNFDITPLWTWEMSERLKTNNDEIVRRIANRVHGILLSKERFELTDEEASRVSALVVYYSLGYSDANNNKESLLDNITESYENNDVNSIQRIIKAAESNPAFDTAEPLDMFFEPVLYSVSETITSDLFSLPETRDFFESHDDVNKNEVYEKTRKSVFKIISQTRRPKLSKEEEKAILKLIPYYAFGLDEILK